MPPPFGELTDAWAEHYQPNTPGEQALIERAVCHEPDFFGVCLNRRRSLK
jgi:hypothetical protein